MTEDVHERARKRREEARESLLHGGERVAKGRQRRDREEDD